MSKFKQLHGSLILSRTIEQHVLDNISLGGLKRATKQRELNQVYSTAYKLLTSGFSEESGRTFSDLMGLSRELTKSTLTKNQI